ncbi:hypothetical protein C8R46DRAFT_372829 [Mycena filopes]|nr:hypothetical protein C8R46DRAFT_372829 [Mycena filopes]
MARFPRKLAVALLLLFLVAFFAPLLTEVYYPAAAPVATALVWFTDAIGRGIAAAAFFSLLATLALFVRDIRRRITGASAAPTPTPAALEAATTDSDTPTSEPSLTQKLLSTVLMSCFLVRQCLRDDVLSRERPLLENALSALVYLFHGLEVLFALFLLLVCLVVVFRRSAAGVADADAVPAATTQPEAVEVLFDDGANGDEEEGVLVQMEEKA